jgi:hypothetical protein
MEIAMRVTAALFAAAFLLAPVGAAQAGPAVSPQACQSWFAKLDRNRDGTIGANEGAKRMLDKVTLIGSNGNGSEFIMQKGFFMIECRIGSFGRPNT